MDLLFKGESASLTTCLFYILLSIFCSSSPSLTSCPAERGNSSWSCRWQDQPIAQQRCWWRRRCGRWIQWSSSARRSATSKHTLYLLYGNISMCMGSMGIFKGCAGLSLSSLRPYPLLPIAVLQIVDSAVVPVDADTYQKTWKEAVLSQNHKVGEKTSKSLDHPWKQEKMCKRSTSKQLFIYSQCS